MKMEDKYANAYQEVIEILKYMSKESVNKIPPKMLQTFQIKRNPNHLFTVDTNKSFEEQELLEETKDIFAIIFRDYWATPYQKERIEIKEKYDRQKVEEEKQKQYPSDKIFSSKSVMDDKVENKQLPIEVKNTWYQKIKNWLKKIWNG